MGFYFFFFQAEDGIRDYKVTGVQTCALPISDLAVPRSDGRAGRGRRDPPDDARRRARRGTERRARVLAHGPIPRDGGLGPAARRPRPTRAPPARPPAPAARPARPGARSGGALAPILLSRSRSL